MASSDDAVFASKEERRLLVNLLNIPRLQKYSEEEFDKLHEESWWFVLEKIRHLGIFNQPRSITIYVKLKQVPWHRPKWPYFGALAFSLAMAMTVVVLVPSERKEIYKGIVSELTITSINPDKTSDEIVGILQSNGVKYSQFRQAQEAEIHFCVDSKNKELSKSFARIDHRLSGDFCGTLRISVEK